MFESSGVSSCFEINQTKLARFVVLVKGSYDSSNRFHNWVHAFSVTHNAFHMMMDPAVVKCQGPLERLAILISCLCHDMYHPGVNGDFLIKSANPLALKYPQVIYSKRWNLACELSGRLHRGLASTSTDARVTL
jgi:cGMP-dependent 3',5'-cyclic phosphodiesterase